MGNDDYRRHRKTPCGCCMSVFKFIPVLFIFAVIGWSYYAYVVELCVLNTENRIAMIFMLLFYHITLVLFLWSYWKTILTSVGRVPDQWRIPDEEVNRLFHADNPEAQKRILNNFARNLPVTNRTMNGSVRFCEKCKIIKPDRAHHCSVCSCCVLKMDHHCPWVNNCVNFYNYKFFVLFLGYALIYCLYVAFTSLHDFIQFWKNDNDYLEQGQLNGTGMGRFHILFLFFISIMFAISLVSLFGYHIYLVLVNRTTLEAFRAPIFRVGGPDKNGYNLGRYANFCEVFGDDWKLWFLPIFTSRGDGMSYPTSTDQSGGGRYNAMGDTNTNSITNRLDVQPTDKLIDAIALNNHQPHLELADGQMPSNNHAALPPSQVIVNIENQLGAITVSNANNTHNAEVANDQIGDQTQSAGKQINGGPAILTLEKIV
ncbi:palmitoyltransferase ZDHHC15B isoform X1 [Drosophila busckii]|uniref:palmitoyltransferase ZDHHC15B isoform X1 n=1 Tax=Drosophila busckii TaxID=30019 RepID=UPI00083EE454|nr:palmitoyltransferase ZDHHC15B isoform X1 [Drosophila busckii]XP_017837755.1 palmitoyltransferase ZDHHC15B isoform X1 [Drosophila busckii]